MQIDTIRVVGGITAYSKCYNNIHNYSKIHDTTKKYIITIYYLGFYLTNYADRLVGVKLALMSAKQL